MAGLRARLASRFLEFVRNERFNPEAAAFRPGATMQRQQCRFTEQNAALAGDGGGGHDPGAGRCTAAVQAA